MCTQSGYSGTLSIEFSINEVSTYKVRIQALISSTLSRYKRNWVLTIDDHIGCGDVLAEDALDLARVLQLAHVDGEAMHFVLGEHL